MERTPFAAGSFEREETIRRIEGVQQTMVGYAGWRAPDASYFDVRLDVFSDAHDRTSQHHIARPGDALYRG